MTIKEMLKSGKTPADIYAEVRKAEKELAAEKTAAEQERKKKEAVAAAREKVVQAMKEYSKAMYGVEPDIKLMDSFDNDLKTIENASKLVTVDDDERLRRFLRGLLL